MQPSRPSSFLRPRFEVSGSTDVTVGDCASTIDATGGNGGSVPRGSQILSPDIPLWATAEVSRGHSSAAVIERLSLSKHRVAAGRASRLEPLLTVGDTAAILNVSVRTVRRLIASGAIPAVLIGRSVRLRPRDIGRLIAEGGVCND